MWPMFFLLARAFDWWGRRVRDSNPGGTSLPLAVFKTEDWKVLASKFATAAMFSFTRAAQPVAFVTDLPLRACLTAAQ